MTTEPGDDERTDITFELEWPGLTEAIVVSANQFIVSPLPPIEGGGFILTIGHVTPPVLFGETLDERLERAADVEALPVRTLIRVSLTNELAIALTDQLIASIRAVAGPDEAEADDNGDE